MRIIDRKDASFEAKDELQKEQNGFKIKRDTSDCYYLLAEPEKTINDIRNEFPNLGSVLNSAYLKTINPREISTVVDPETGNLAILYEVDVQYDSSFAQDNDDDKTDRDNPPNTLPKRRWYSEKEEEVLEKDADTGAAIVTGCNEAIIIPHKVSIYVLEISRYENAPFDPNTLKNYIGTRNENTFYGAAAGNAVMDEIEAEEEWIEDSNNVRKLWIKATYRIKFRIKPYADEGWQLLVLHEGYLYKPKAALKPRQFLDKETKQPRKVLLITDPDSPNNNGVILPDGADPNYLKFNRFPKKDWSDLQLEY